MTKEKKKKSGLKEGPLLVNLKKYKRIKRVVLWTTVNDSKLNSQQIGNGQIPRKTQNTKMDKRINRKSEEIYKK